MVKEGDVRKLLKIIFVRISAGAVVYRNILRTRDKKSRLNVVNKMQASIRFSEFHQQVYT